MPVTDQESALFAKWFRRGRSDERRRLILTGTGPASYSLLRELQESGRFDVVALINEEPWQHKTRILNVLLHYPSELLALCAKHQVAAVVSIEGEGWQVDSNSADALQADGIKLIRFSEQETTQQRLALLRDQFQLSQ
ncbi:nucleoside-diphosphate sugar epimerase/dehydratase [Neptuniibacter halophilus]|uniref:nucleoside-diphosphate sugar epimerase/dehydratase n=1 Tax=Neptuniibacter halophilus TaxID=651666 RepID=UPI002573B46D|nr:hypothetical protein [Neptuniibacter halophilus]